MLTLLALAVFMMATATTSASRERVEINPPPDLGSFVLNTINDAETPVVADFQNFEITANVAASAIVVDNSATVVDMPAMRFIQTPIEPMLVEWIFYNRMPRPPLVVNHDDNLRANRKNFTYAY